jgi:hypothetical protein
MLLLGPCYPVSASTLTLGTSPDCPLIQVDTYGLPGATCGVEMQPGEPITMVGICPVLWSWGFVRSRCAERVGGRLVRVGEWTYGVTIGDRDVVRLPPEE